MAKSADKPTPHAYDRMLERVKDFIEEAEEEFGPKIEYAVNRAREKASELGELTREEAEKISDYIQHDIHDAAEYMENEGKELADWLKFDVELIEDRLADILSQVVDTTKLEYQKLAERAKQANLWNSGEITGPGTLTCANCGHQLVFHETKEIPTCPQCKGSLFQRRDAK